MVQVRPLHAPGADPDCFMFDQPADSPAITACGMPCTHQLLARRMLRTSGVVEHAVHWALSELSLQGDASAARQQHVLGQTIKAAKVNGRQGTLRQQDSRDVSRSTGVQTAW